MRPFVFGTRLGTRLNFIEGESQSLSGLWACSLHSASVRHCPINSSSPSVRYFDFFGHSSLVNFTNWRAYDTLKNLYTGASGRSGKTGPDTRPDAGRCRVAPDHSKVALGSRSVPELEAEVSKLRKELAEARMERDNVKKAAAYFAWESLPSTRS